jgi:hypothetical protein
LKTESNKKKNEKNVVLLVVNLVPFHSSSSQNIWQKNCRLLIVIVGNIEGMFLFTFATNFAYVKIKQKQTSFEPTVLVEISLAIMVDKISMVTLKENFEM